MKSSYSVVSLVGGLVFTGGYMAHMWGVRDNNIKYKITRTSGAGKGFDINKGRCCECGVRDTAELHPGTE